ncbi:MAG: MFS transporter [Candidatus Micrarchaeota archaeon]|nr:MFS transporter [Candidatus Micrarchaeota archaeon]
MAEEATYDKKYINRALILFSAFAILVLYIETMLIPSLPSIGRQYHVDAAETSLIVSLYLVSGVALSPVIGKLGDIYGKKRVLNYILPIYLVAVGLTGFSPNFEFLLISRTIQGIGLTIFALLISLIQEEFPREMVPKAMAIIVAMFGIGSAIGLPLGSFVSNSFGWQASYHTALPLVLITTIAIMYYIKESKYTRPNVKIDFIGAIGLAASLAMIVFALSEGTAFGWTSAITLFLMIFGIMILIGTVLYENKVPDPVMSKKLLSIKNVYSANVITLFAGLGFFFAYQIFAYLFESPGPLGFGFNIFQTGLAMAPFAVVNAIVAPVLGRYIPRIGVKPFFFSGSFIGIAGFLVALIANGPTMSIIGEAIIGTGIALINIPTVNLLVLSIEQRDMGIATSMNSVFRFLGSALGAPIAGLLIATYESRTAFTISFILGILTMIATIIFAAQADEIFGKNRKVTKVEHEVSI